MAMNQVLGAEKPETASVCDSTKMGFSASDWLQALAIM